MIVHPELHRIRYGLATADEAQASLRRLMDEHGSAIFGSIYATLRIWTSKTLRDRRGYELELVKWFHVIRAVTVTMNRRETTDEYVKMQVLSDMLFDYLTKVRADAAKAADHGHYEYLVHRRLGRFMCKPGDPIDFVTQRPPGEMSWSGKGDQCVEFITVRRPGTEDKSRVAISREWCERMAALEGDQEVGAGVPFIEYSGSNLIEIERTLKAKEQQIAGAFDLPYLLPEDEK